MDQPIGNLSELSLPGSRAGQRKKPSRGLTSLILNALLRQANGFFPLPPPLFIAVLKLRGTGHHLSILPLAVDCRSQLGIFFNQVV
ncbi:hypothetical protein Peur_002921 [Populus x canadensis]